jgi:hypothetical protein
MRDELLPEVWRNYHIINILPQWSWQTWITLLVIIIGVALVDGAFWDRHLLEQAHSSSKPLIDVYEKPFRNPENRGASRFIAPGVILLIIGAAWMYGSQLANVSSAVQHPEVKEKEVITSKLMKERLEGWVVSAGVYQVETVAAGPHEDFRFNIHTFGFSGTVSNITDKDVILIQSGNIFIFTKLSVENKEQLIREAKLRLLPLGAHYKLARNEAGDIYFNMEETISYSSLTEDTFLNAIDMVSRNSSLLTTSMHSGNLKKR